MCREYRATDGDSGEMWQAAPEDDRDILSLKAGPENKILIGYESLSGDDYQKLAPFVLDVLETLLADCTVFIWLKTPPIPAHILRILWMRAKLSDAIPNFAAQIAAEHHPEAFFDGTDELLVKTQGANRWLMERFYQVSNCATAFQHIIYGFYTAPTIDPKSPYEDIHFSVVHPLPDYEITYRDFGVELDIKINLATVSAEEVIKKVKSVCMAHNKTLLT